MNLQLEKYYPLIFKIINQFDYKFQDELFNECYLKLYHLQFNFNPSKGKFETYAFKHLYFTCKHFLEKNQLNHQSLDETAYNEENEEMKKVDLLQSELDLESQISNQDYLIQHSKNLTEVEKFIQAKFYKDGLTPKQIIKVYSDYHFVNSEKSIRKIIQK